jgi:hypothetical protein
MKAAQIIAPHMRLHEWVAGDEGYFAREGLDSEFSDQTGQPGNAGIEHPARHFDAGIGHIRKAPSASVFPPMPARRNAIEWSGFAALVDHDWLRSVAAAALRGALLLPFEFFVLLGLFCALACGAIQAIIGFAHQLNLLAA